MTAAAQSLAAVAPRRNVGNDLVHIGPDGPVLTVNAGQTADAADAVTADWRQTPVLKVANLQKAFGATTALRSGSLELLPGEIHCVIGENGCGKSTLVKVLAGVCRPDAGSLSIDGRERAFFRTPRAAMHDGIATVFQEVLVVEPRSVLENIWLGTGGLLRGGPDDRTRSTTARDALEQLIGEAPLLQAPIEALSLSDRQTCCIVRALVRRPRVLLLDEATSALDVSTRDALFTVLRRLAAGGAAIVFISHRMDEIFAIGDRCTVMRSGESVATLRVNETDANELVRLMTGAGHLTTVDEHPPARPEPGPVVLRVDGLALAPGATPIAFELRSGELVGLGGLEGHGQDAFIKTLAGMRRTSAEITVAGMSIKTPQSAATAGLAYIPRERRAEALFESKSVRENFGLPTLAQDLRLGLLRPRETRARFTAWVSELGIVLANPEQPITALSGGNQQKVVIARWLASDPRVLLLNDPTRGVDIGAKRDLYKLLIDLAGRGLAIVMLSTELDELVELMDRVLVFREGELTRELDKPQLSRTALVSAFFGRPA